MSVEQELAEDVFELADGGGADVEEKSSPRR